MSELQKVFSVSFGKPCSGSEASRFIRFLRPSLSDPDIRTHDLEKVIRYVDLVNE